MTAYEMLYQYFYWIKVAALIGCGIYLVKEYFYQANWRDRVKDWWG